MDPARFIVAAIMLLGASWWDMRERRIPNTYWFPFVAFAAIFVAGDITQAIQGTLRAWVPLIGATVVALLSYLFFRMGLWGGADAKGVMVLAFLARDNLHPPTTLAVLDSLVAGMSLVLLIPIGLTLWNLVRGDTAFPAMLIGRRMPIAQAKGQRVWPLQDADGWRYRARIGEDIRHVYRDLEKAGRTDVWTTIQLPLMLFIFAGYILVNIFGSPASWLAQLAR